MESLMTADIPARLLEERRAPQSSKSGGGGISPYTTPLLLAGAASCVGSTALALSGKTKAAILFGGWIPFAIAAVLISRRYNP